MTYIFQAGMPRRVVHVARFDSLGRCTWRALCGIGLLFDRTCNLPLGQRVCRRCRRLVAT